MELVAMVRCISNEDVRSILDMDTTIEYIEQAFRAEAEGRAVNIPRSDMILPMGADEAYVFKVHPGMIEDFSVAALRVQSDRIRWTETRKVKEGVAADGQYVQYVTVYDTETTEPILIYKDGFVSKMRVGATNAIAAKYLAPEDASTLGMLGAGRQATGQIRGFDSVFDFETIQVYSPTRENREAFAREWDDRLDPTVVAVDSARKAVEGVDIMACASNALTPVFETDWIEPGMHVSAIKNPEVPDDAIDHVDTLYVNTPENPSGPNNYAPRGSDYDERLTHGYTISGHDLSTARSVADLVAGGYEREPDEKTFFLNNLGVGLQFAAVGRHLFEKAEEEDLGTNIGIGTFVQSVW